MCDHAHFKPWAKPIFTPHAVLGHEYRDGDVLRQEWRCPNCGEIVATASRSVNKFGDGRSELGAGRGIGL